MKRFTVLEGLFFFCLGWWGSNELSRQQARREMRAFDANVLANRFSETLEDGEEEEPPPELSPEELYYERWRQLMFLREPRRIQ